MNGVANSILSFLLSWIRALINHLWSVFSSENGSMLYQFFADNWLSLLVVLCIVCFAADRIIYFFRWRPDDLWATRRAVRKARRMHSSSQKEAWEDIPSPAVKSYETPSPTMAYAPLQQATLHYTPVRTREGYTQIYTPPQDLEPVFDDDSDLWQENPPVEQEWNAQPAHDFAVLNPEPAAYYRDVQAGFAPPVAPEQLYSPVHPGLNEESFRQNFGLEEDVPQPAAVVRAPVFRPFTAVESQPAPKSPNPFSRLARRAKDLVSMNDDEAPTIRDLQPTVDVSKAFHEPVYPQPLSHIDDDRRM